MKLGTKSSRKPAGRSAKVKVARPSLRLVADRDHIRTQETIAVKVDFKGVDGVSFALEPRSTFAIDLKSLSKPGLVRLKGKRDGICTLIARAGDIERMIHVRCLGPQVKLHAWGYLPRR